MALLVALAVIALYAVLVGAEPPVVRAAIMGGLSTLALIFGRHSDGLTSLLVTANVMTPWQPMALWDVSFQISFAAMLGPILHGERLAQWVEALRTDQVGDIEVTVDRQRVEGQRWGSLKLRFTHCRPARLVRLIGGFTGT